MSIMTQGFLPFNFGIRANGDGTCSTPTKLGKNFNPFPYVKGRRIRNLAQPEIAFYPEAIEFCVNKYCQEHHCSMSVATLDKVLKKEGFPEMNHGNITNAVNMRLITRLVNKNFESGSKKGEQLLASNQLGIHLNDMTHEITRWCEDLEDGTETPFEWNEHREIFLLNLMKTIRQRGFFKVKTESEQAFPF